MFATVAKEMASSPRLLLMLMIVLAAAAGCGRKKGSPTADTGPDGPPVNGDWIVTHTIADPESLNLVTAQDAGSQELWTYMYESLTNTDPETLERIPWLADSLPATDSSHLRYDFHIRKNAVFSDGKPITAADFIFYLKCIKNPGIMNAAPLRGYFTDIDSAATFGSDPLNLRVVMRKPYFLADVVIGDMYAMPKHIWDPTGLSDRISFRELNSTDTNAKENPLIKELADQIQDVEKGKSKQYLVGSGPYMFEDWRRNERITLARNPNYWNSADKYGKAYPDKILWRTINDPNAAVTSLKAGELDVMPAIEKSIFVHEQARLEANGYKPVEYEFPAYNYVGYNEENPLFADSRVRNALAHAIDRESIIRNIYFNFARSIQSPIFYKRPECDTTLHLIAYDLNTAKAKLAEAGWSDSDNDGILDKMIDGKKTDFRFTILLNSGNQRRQSIALIFVEALKKLGIDAKTTTLEWATFQQRTRNGDFDAMVGGWALDVTEGDMYQTWHSKSAEKGGSNFIRFRNPKVDELIEKTRSEFSFEKRREYYLEIQKIIYEQQPYNFLVSEKVTGSYSARIRGVHFFAPRPCYNAGRWWVPKAIQKHKTTATP